MNYPDEDILEERAINKVEIGEFENAIDELFDEYLLVVEAISKGSKIPTY